MSTEKIRRLAAIVWLLAAPVALAGPERPRPPELRIEAPEQLAELARRLRAVDRDSLAALVELVGLEEPGAPIRVVLAPAGSEAARRAPMWGVAYAVGSTGPVVIIPTRVPGYPDQTYETVLRHEVAHVLIARAAGGRPLPRWFNEGLAVYASRPWGLEDRGRLTLATFRRGGTLADLDRRFSGGRHSANGAYAMSAAFVRYLLESHGERAAARILAHVAAGDGFPRAYRRATGVYLADEEEGFFRHVDLWSKWIPLIGSSSTMWMLITLLALVAFRKRRQRDAEMRQRWEEEEEAERLAELEEAPTDEWIH